MSTANRRTGSLMELRVSPAQIGRADSLPIDFATKWVKIRTMVCPKRT